MFFCFLFFLCYGAVASAKRSFLKDNFEWEIKLNSLTSILDQNYHNHELNYLNSILKKSEFELKQELQPDISLRLKKIPIKWKAKPKLKFKVAQNIYEDNKARNLQISEYGFWENYISIEPISSFEFNFGIIQRQWGPSELINPSQIMYTQQILSLEPFQYNQGMEMAELLWTPSQSIGFNLLSELKSFEWDHSDEPNYAKREFQNRNIFRAEYSTSSGNFQLGQVLASKKTGKNRWSYGGYGFYNYTDWTQVYIDYVTQGGSDLYYIDEQSILTLPYEDSEYLFSVAVIGHRLTLEMGLEWKIEYISNSFAKNQEERNVEVKLLKTNAYNTKALLAFYQGRYLLPSSSLVYNSIRWDDPFFLKKFFSTSTFYFRLLNSLVDQSGFIQVEFENSLSDSWSQGISLVQSYGEPMKELNSELDYLAIYSLKKVF